MHQRKNCFISREGIASFMPALFKIYSIFHNLKCISSGCSSERESRTKSAVNSRPSTSEKPTRQTSESASRFA